MLKLTSNIEATKGNIPITKKRLEQPKRQKTLRSDQQNPIL